MSPEERAAWEARNAEIDARIRQLRELVARGEASLKARQQAQPGPPPAPGSS